MTLGQYAGVWLNLVTIGIARASWTNNTNKTMGRGGAGFAFAWFFPNFAAYGVASRMNQVLASKGSHMTVSPLACFFLYGWPFFGTKKRLRTGVKLVNDSFRVGQHAVTQTPQQPQPPVVGGPV